MAVLITNRRNEQINAATIASSVMQIKATGETIESLARKFALPVDEINLIYREHYREMGISVGPVIRMKRPRRSYMKGVDARAELVAFKATAYDKQIFSDVAKAVGISMSEWLWKTARKEAVRELKALGCEDPFTV